MRYDYFCEVNNKTVEVSHSMNESLYTWGELCERAGIDPGSTPSDAPVRRIISGGSLTMFKGSCNYYNESSARCLCNENSCSLPSGPSCCCPGTCGHKHVSVHSNK